MPPDADGERLCELCSDFTDSGVCDFIEEFSVDGPVLRPKRVVAGGVWVPPVITLDALESSSPSLSYVWEGDFSPRLP